MIQFVVFFILNNIIENVLSFFGNENAITFAEVFAFRDHRVFEVK